MQDLTVRPRREKQAALRDPIAFRMADIVEDALYASNAAAVGESVAADRAACEADVFTFMKNCLPLYVPDDAPDCHAEWYKIGTAPPDDPIYCDDAGNRTKIGAVVAAPRGHAKSTVFSFGSVLFNAITRKKEFIVIISDVQETAINFVDAIRRELEENQVIRKTWPELRTGDEIRPALKWTTSDLVITMIDPETGRPAHQTRIVAKGTGSRLRGIRFRHKRPDLIVGDDLENDDLVGTPEQRRKTFDWLVKVVIPALDPKVGQLIIVGTILHYASLLSRLLADRPVTDMGGSDGFDPGSVFIQRTYQAIIDYKTKQARPLWPARYSLEILMRIKRMGLLAFMQEYMNQPVDEDTTTVKPESVKWWYKHEVHFDKAARVWYFRGVPLTIYAGVDTAIEEKADSDWFAMAVIGLTEGKDIVTLYTYRAHLALHEQVRVLDEVTYAWQPQEIVVESNAAQKWLGQEAIRRGRWMPKIRMIKSVLNKFQRLNATGVWWANGQVWLRAATDDESGTIDETKMVRVHWQQADFYEECITFPHGKHDDMFDAWEDATQGAAFTGMKLTRVA